MQTERNQTIVIVGAPGQIGHKFMQAQQEVDIVIHNNQEHRPTKKMLLVGISNIRDCYKFDDIEVVAKDPTPWYNEHGNKRRIYK